MAQLPDGIAFVIESKTAGQPKWHREDEFIADIASGYPESDAQADAQAAFDALHAAHSGGTREYHMLKCVELAYEV